MPRRPRKPSGRSRVGLEAVRRAAIARAIAAGVPADRAAGLVAFLLRFDEVGAEDLGIATLPGLMDRIDRGEVDPRSEGRLLSERGATAVLDAARGLGPIVLRRAGELAAEKARDTGFGLVRVSGVDPTIPAMPVAVDLAIGPTIGLALDADQGWSLALSRPGQLPVVLDSRLGRASGPAPGMFDTWRLLVTAGDRLIGALDPNALRWTSPSEAGSSEIPGRLDGQAWEDRRRRIQDSGVEFTAEALDRLRGSLESRGIDWPDDETTRT